MTKLEGTVCDNPGCARVCTNENIVGSDWITVKVPSYAKVPAQRRTNDACSYQCAIRILEICWHG